MTDGAIGEMKVAVLSDLTNLLTERYDLDIDGSGDGDGGRW